MTTTIPTYALSALAAYEENPSGVFCMGRQPAAPRVPIFRPYRSSYYKVGICLQGRAVLHVNLEAYEVLAGCLLLLPAHCIKQWVSMSADFESLGVFFMPDFVAATVGPVLDKFTFFAGVVRHVVQLPSASAGRLEATFELLQQRYDEPHAYRHELLRSLIQVLLYEIAAVYDQQHVAVSAGQTRSQLIAAGFKQLVQAHFVAERGLAFYAARLCITPKHLTETVRAVTGRRAAEWLADAVTLEARVLLQNPALTVAQVADQQQFADQSAFGRFFRHHTGLSPTAYRLSQ